MPWRGPEPEVPEADVLSPDRRRTERRHALLREGRHPLMGGPVREGETCGSCAHHFVRETSPGRRFQKCALRCSSGAATDVRVCWPACLRWKPDESGEPRRER